MLIDLAAIERAVDGILDRRWYTNHGPLARELETVWASATGQRHAIAVANPTIALAMTCDALCWAGEIALSALAPPRCAQALRWAGLVPRFLDVSPTSLAMTTTEKLPTALLTAGRDGAVPEIVAQSCFGDGVAGAAIATMVDLPGFADAAGAACILTDDDELAARLRNIRSSYGAIPPRKVVRTGNGRLSEAQAAMALLYPPGRSFQELFENRIKAVVGDIPLLSYGRDWLIVAEDHQHRQQLTKRCVVAGLEVDRPSRSTAATGCCSASMILENSLLVRSASFQV